MATWKSFEDIDAWQLAREFCKDVFRIINYDLFKVTTTFRFKRKKHKERLKDN